MGQPLWKASYWYLCKIKIYWTWKIYSKGKNMPKTNKKYFFSKCTCIHTHINTNNTHTLEQSHMVSLIPVKIYVIKTWKDIEVIQLLPQSNSQNVFNLSHLYSSLVVWVGLISTPIRGWALTDLREPSLLQWLAEEHVI